MARISADDLAWASEWVASFDADEDVDGAVRRDRVVAYLDAEIGRRQDVAVSRAAAKKLGVKPAAVLAAMRRKRVASSINTAYATV